ncbi:MAG: hypothetical protein WCW67_04795 [Candidatus Margulisiibacteriota bacterium]|jgi:hypothetical protein
MKKLLSLALVLGLGAMLMAGCSSTSSPTTSVPTSYAASSIGALASTGLAIDNSILDVAPYAMAANGARVRMAAPTAPAYGSDNWWTSTNTWTSSSYTYTYNYKFRIWKSTGSEITTAAELDAADHDNISKLWTYTTFDTTLTTTSGAVTITYQLGESTDKPLKFEGIGSASPTIDGLLKYSGAYGGESFNISMTYNSLTLNASGYPSGTVDFSFNVSGGVAYAGTITYDGTSSATLAFTSGGSGTYTINLDSGVVAAMVD